jgi:hypothetical protein
LIEFDKNQSYVLKDIYLELNTSVKEIEKLIGKSHDPTTKSQYKEIAKRIADALAKLEQL